jgi:hypothetical protein
LLIQERFLCCAPEAACSQAAGKIRARIGPGREPKRMPETLVRDIQSCAQSALAASPIFVLRELSVRRNGDSLLLSGQVDSFYHKQLAQEVVRSVADGYRVVNTVDVSYFGD